MDAQLYLDAVAAALAKSEAVYHLRIELRTTLRTDAPPLESSVLIDTAVGELADLTATRTNGHWQIEKVTPKPQVPWGVGSILTDALEAVSAD